MVNAIERQTVISRHDEGLEEEGEQQQEEVREKLGSAILRFTLVQSDLSPQDVRGTCVEFDAAGLW